MHALRRIALASLWGAVGPVAVASVIAALWGRRGYRDTQLDELTLNILFNIRAFSLLIASEAVLGIVYGATRAGLRASSTSFSVGVGAAIWGGIGLPVFLPVMLLHIMFFDWNNYDPPDERSLPMEVLSLLGIYVAHIGGGAIAGFQVNYFLAATENRSLSSELPTR